MYIGGVDAKGLHHLVWEIVDNSVDEYLAEAADHIVVTLHKDGASLTVSDNGRGIPVDKHPKIKKSALEVILTTLHAGGKFSNKNYLRSGGLHGVGASVVNALSIELEATVHRDGYEWSQRYKRGKPTTEVKKVRPVPRTRDDHLLPTRRRNLSPRAVQHRNHPPAPGGHHVHSRRPADHARR